MKTEIHEIGFERHRVVVIDDALDDARSLIALAATQTFPTVTSNSYPGIRRHLSSKIVPERAYVETLRALATPIMDEVFGIGGFRIVQAAFSLITRRPGETHPFARIPHYDSSNGSRYALLHFLSPQPQGGTGFYRQTRTGIEQVSERNKAAFQASALNDFETQGALEPVYIQGTTLAFEQIAFFEGRFNRVLIYSGSLLHSAQMPDNFAYGADPHTGRLTTNLLLQA